MFEQMLIEMFQPIQNLICPPVGCVTEFGTRDFDRNSAKLIDVECEAKGKIHSRVLKHFLELSFEF